MRNDSSDSVSGVVSAEIPACPRKCPGERELPGRDHRRLSPMATPNVPPGRERRTFERDWKSAWRLRRQVGTPACRGPSAEGGGEPTRHFHARNWTEARKLHEK